MGKPPTHTHTLTPVLCLFAPFVSAASPAGAPAELSRAGPPSCVPSSPGPADEGAGVGSPRLSWSAAEGAVVAAALALAGSTPAQMKGEERVVGDLARALCQSEGGCDWDAPSVRMRGQEVYVKFNRASDLGAAFPERKHAPAVRGLPS